MKLHMHTHELHGRITAMIASCGSRSAPWSNSSFYCCLIKERKCNGNTLLFVLRTFVQDLAQALFVVSDAMMHCVPMKCSGPVP